LLQGFGAYPANMGSWAIRKIGLRRKGAPRRMLIVLAAAALGLGAVFCVYRATFVGRYGEVEPGRLYRSRQPRRFQYPVLVFGRGIRRVIDLRSAGEDPHTFAEERSVCRRDGVEFFNIPVTAQVPTQAQAERFLRLVDTSPGPVLVHCEFGRNRTGMMCAVYRVARRGVPVQRAFREELTAYKARPDGPQRKRIVHLLEQFAGASPPRGGTPKARRPQASAYPPVTAASPPAPAPAAGRLPPAPAGSIAAFDGRFGNDDRHG